VSGRRYRGTWSISGKPPEDFLLDKFSVADVKKWIEFQNAILKYHWDYYCALAYKRSRIANEIKTSLLEEAEKSFKFTRWQRVVKYKCALEPLSMAGSLVDPGGRFNIGDINPAQFPPFPALYSAIDKATALQEILCKQKEPGTKLINLDFRPKESRFNHQYIGKRLS